MIPIENRNLKKSIVILNAYSRQNFFIKIVLIFFKDNIFRYFQVKNYVYFLFYGLILNCSHYIED